MIKLFLFFSLTLLTFANNKDLKKSKNKHTIKIAVIDTGFDFKSIWKDAEEKGLKKPVTCKNGHKDFTGKGMQDVHGHGTHIAGLIAKYAGEANYCLIIIKYFDSFASGEVNLRNTIKSFEYLSTLDVDIINYSGGGLSFNREEYKAIKKLLDKGVLLVAAAGNEGMEIDHHVFRNRGGEIAYIERKTTEIYFVNIYAERKSFFPAAYDPRIISVKAVDKDGRKIKSSNYGAAISHAELGLNVLSLGLNNNYGYLTGTSQACAIKTGKVIKKWK